MEYLPNGLSLELPEGTFPLSTDSMVLAHFIHPGKHARILDLGSGCGTIGLLLCASNSSCHITGLEIDETAHNAAVDNIIRNQLSERLESTPGDIRKADSHFPQGSFDIVVSNPPYFSGGPASESIPSARRDDLCSTDDLCRAAAWSVKFGGDFYLVHRPEKLGEIISCAGKYRLEAKALCLVRHREGGPISLILLKMRKGAHSGLIWQELALHHADGTPTQLYKEIYHL